MQRSRKTGRRTPREVEICPGASSRSVGEKRPEIRRFEVVLRIVTEFGREGKAGSNRTGVRIDAKTINQRPSPSRHGDAKRRQLRLRRRHEDG